jgi:hypothetical protein
MKTYINKTRHESVAPDLHRLYQLEGLLMDANPGDRPELMAEMRMLMATRKGFKSLVFNSLDKQQKP